MNRWVRAVHETGPVGGVVHVSIFLVIGLFTNVAKNLMEGRPLLPVLPHMAIFLAFAFVALLFVLLRLALATIRVLRGDR